MRVLVAGATGQLGSRVVRACEARGHAVRALVRDPRGLPSGEREVAQADPLSDGAARLRAVCDGVDAVFSALGATSVTVPAPERRSYLDVDTPANLALLRAAQDAGVPRFAYVSILDGPRLRDLAYVEAHERIVDALAASGLDAVVVRSNGFFSSYRELLSLAARGVLPLFGDGSARSNPIHDDDLAQVCADALEGRNGAAVDAGGPETMTRREEAELAFAAVGRKPRFVRLPHPVAAALAGAAGLRDRRRAEILRFLEAISRRDMVGPAYGTRRLGEYLRDEAAARGLAR